MPIELEPYVKKLNNSRRRVMLVNGILQNVQVCGIFPLSKNTVLCGFKADLLCAPPHTHTHLLPFINMGERRRYIGITLSICSSVLVSVCVCSISPEPLNHFFFTPNLIRWCIITRQCVMRKHWFTISNVKVTARA